jgi:hypothetical protein
MNTWILDTAIARLLSTNAVVLTEQPNSQMVGNPEIMAFANDTKLAIRLLGSHDTTRQKVL